MQVLQPSLVPPLFLTSLLFIGRVANAEDDLDYLNGYTCFYDDQCLFLCAEVDDPSECLNYSYETDDGRRKLVLEEGGEQGVAGQKNKRMTKLLEENRQRYLQQTGAEGITVDYPYARSNMPGSTCLPTSDSPKPVGYCCPSCDLDDSAVEDACNDFYVNADSCQTMEGLNYFIDVIQEYQDGTHTNGACYAVNSGGGTDPHIKTFKGTWFDYMGACDLVFLQVPKLDLDVHIRTTIRHEYSYIESASLRIGSDVLEVGSWGDYYWNGVNDGDLKGPARMGGGLYPIYHEQVSEKQHKFEIQIGRKTVNRNEKIVLSTFKDMVTIHLIDATMEHFEYARGLMGTYNKGELVARDGGRIVLSTSTTANKTTTVPNEQEVINAYAQTWQVQKDEPMLFQSTRSPVAGEQCELPGAAAMSETKRRRLGESAATRSAAEEACSHLSPGKAQDNCIQDVLVVGDVDIARAGVY